MNGTLTPTQMIAGREEHLVVVHQFNLDQDARYEEESQAIPVHDISREVLSPTTKNAGEIKVEFDYDKGKFILGKENLAKWPQILKDEHQYINSVLIHLARVFREKNKSFTTRIATLNCCCMSLAELLMLAALFMAVFGINMGVNAFLCATVSCGKTTSYTIAAIVLLIFAIIAVIIGSYSLLSTELMYNLHAWQHVAKIVDSSEYNRKVQTKKGELKYTFQLLKNSYDIKILWFLNQEGWDPTATPKNLNN